MSTLIVTRQKGNVLYPGRMMPTEKKKTFLQAIDLYIEKESHKETRFKWPGIAMVAQAFIITPLVAVIILFTGNHIPFWFLATASMYSTFIPVLAGLPVRTVMITFFVNLLISVLMIISLLILLIF